MPRDEFERLERRWRERPLFLERPSRRPLWALVLLMAAVGLLLLGFAAVGPPGPNTVIDRFTGLPAQTPSEQTASAAHERAKVPLTPAGR
jgi:hypothetical protein